MTEEAYEITWEEVEGSLLSLREAARLLRVHPTTIVKWSRKGKIRVVRVGANRRVPLSEVLRFVKEKG